MSVSGEELEAMLLRLRAGERRLEVQILLGLIELDRRKLYLDWGCASLFAYCVERLGYCESSAGRRIAAARAMRRIPRIEGMLRSGEARLSTVAMAAEEHREKFERARALLSRKHPEGVAFAEVFEAALDAYLKRHDPGAADEMKPAHSPRGSDRPSRSTAAAGAHSPRGSDRRSRSIPAELRREEGRCSESLERGWMRQFT